MIYGNALNYMMNERVISPRKTNLTNLYIMKRVRTEKMLMLVKNISRVVRAKNLLEID